MLDARHEGASYRRIEVITGAGGDIGRPRKRLGPWRRASRKTPTFPRWLGATALPVGCSRCGGTNLRRRQEPPDRASCQSRSLPKAILRHASRTYTLHQSRQLSRVHQLSIVTTFFAPRLSASVTSAWTMPRLAPVIKTVLFATFMFALPRIFTWPSLLCQVARSPTSSANRRTARIAFVFPRGLRHVQFCRTPA